MFAYKPRRLAIAVILALIVASIGLPTAALAAPAGCTVGGDAYAVGVTGTLLGLPVVAVKVNDAPIGNQSTLLAGSINLLGGVLTASNLTITNSSKDTSTALQASATSISDVENLDLGLLVGAISIPHLITAGVIKAEANSAINAHSAGSDFAGTNFVGTITVAGTTITVTGAPNQTATVNIPLVANITLTLNEQSGTLTGNPTNAVNNAIDLTVTLLSGVTSLNVIVAHADSSASCAPVPAAGAICSIASIVAGPPKQINLVIQNTAVGVSNITGLSLVNATASPFNPAPPYSPATFAPITVTATKIDQTMAASISFTIVNGDGSQTVCDPVATTLVHGAGQVQKLTGIAQGEGNVTISNGNPGLSALLIVVLPSHGPASVFRVTGLTSNELTHLNINSALGTGANAVLLVGIGGKGSSADVALGS